jgi:hypothetical protein
MAGEELRDGPRFIAEATVQLNALNRAGALDPRLTGATLDAPGAPIHDLDGSVLFYRVSLRKAGARVGYVDVADHAVFGEPIVALGTGSGWSAAELLWLGRHEAIEHYDVSPAADARLVAYSFPKLAVEVIEPEGTSILLEAGSWQPIPDGREREDNEPPGNFERWSLLAAAGEDVLAERRRRLEDITEQLGSFGEIAERLTIEPRLPGPLLPPIFTRSLELHYSPLTSDHYVCYQLRPQQTSVWCVAASVEMLLDFYRYDYEQTRIAEQLGLGTISNPSGLPYSRDHDVVTALESLTGGALEAQMVEPVVFDLFIGQIEAARPVISFIPGHSRTVAGFTETFSELPALRFQGLLVYDPWPPGAGLITRWENFNAMTYRKSFTAEVKLY